MSEDKCPYSFLPNYFYFSAVFLPPCGHLMTPSLPPLDTHEHKQCATLHCPRKCQVTVASAHAASNPGYIQNMFMEGKELQPPPTFTSDFCSSSRTCFPGGFYLFSSDASLLAGELSAAPLFPVPTFQFPKVI